MYIPVCMYIRVGGAVGGDGCVGVFAYRDTHTETQTHRQRHKNSLTHTTHTHTF